MSDERVLIHAGRLIDVERSEVLTDRVIVIDGDRITDVLTEAPAESSAVTIDLSGHTVLPGLEEGRILTGHTTPEGVARFYRERGATLVVVKLGADGAYYDGPAGSGRIAGFPVAKVVDTVGAGDGFAVGVISALLEGLDVPSAVRRGAWIGARAVQVLGDTEGLPTRAELLAAAL